MPQQENGLTQELGRLQLQLQGNQDALNRANQNKITFESALNVARSTEATLKRLMEAANDPNNRAQAPGSPGAPPKKKSEELQEQLDTLTSRYSPQYPDVQRLKVSLENVQAREKQEEKAAKDQSTALGEERKDIAVASKDDQIKDSQNKDPLPRNLEAVRALSAERVRIVLLNAELMAVTTELKTRQANEQKILDEIGSLEARMKRLPIREQEMAAVTRDYEISKTNYHSLQDKIFAADMASEMEHNQKSERFIILDPARVPEKPIRPNRPWFGGVGCAAALGLSLAFWLFFDIRKNQLLGEWELPEGAVVLGRVPNLSGISETGGEGLLSARVAISAIVGVLSIASAAAYLFWIRH